MLNWGTFLEKKTGGELIDTAHYYTYFYNIRGTTQDIRENIKNNNILDVNKSYIKTSEEQFKVDKYFNTYIDPKISAMKGQYKTEKDTNGQPILITDTNKDLQNKINGLVQIHTKIWQFLIKIDMCEKTHTSKKSRDICSENQKIFFPPAITHEVLDQYQFENEEYNKGERNYLLKFFSPKMKTVFYKGNGSDGLMYKQRGSFPLADYYLYDNFTHTFNDKKDNSTFGKDYHTICIDDKGIAAPILKLFNGISSLLSFMFIFLDPKGSDAKIRASFGKSSSGVVGTAVNALAMTLM